MDWDSGRQWGSSAPKVGGGGRCVCERERVDGLT